MAASVNVAPGEEKSLCPGGGGGGEQRGPEAVGEEPWDRAGGCAEQRDQGCGGGGMVKGL